MRLLSATVGSLSSLAISYGDIQARIQEFFRGPRKGKSLGNYSLGKLPSKEKLWGRVKPPKPLDPPLISQLRLAGRGSTMTGVYSEYTFYISWVLLYTSWIHCCKWRRAIATPVSHMKPTPSIWYPPVQIIYIICTPRSILYYIGCTPGGTFYLDNKYALHIIWTPPPP